MKTIEEGQIVDESGPPLPHDEYTEAWRKEVERERLANAGRKASKRAKADALAALPATGGGPSDAGVPDATNADPIAEGAPPSSKRGK